jgi:hypothetical protein
MGGTLGGRTVSLGVLDSIRVASPCRADWDRMRGDGRVRYCGECRLHVYNFSAMTREEAEALVLANEGRLCARFYRRADGTVLTRDCPVGLRAVRARAAAGIARIAAAAACLIGGAISLGTGRTVRLREVRPFSTLCGWMNPGPPAAAFTLGKVAIMGDVCPAPAPPPGAPIRAGGGR